MPFVPLWRDQADGKRASIHPVATLGFDPSIPQIATLFINHYTVEQFTPENRKVDCTRVQRVNRQQELGT